MIVENQRAGRTAAMAAPDRWSRRIRSRAFLYHAAAFLGFFALAVALQIASGAYHCEFGGYPDEPAHYVTSLMVRDYIAQMKPVAPMEFASNYYDHYPKVAFGHWPPLLYMVHAPWMLLFSPSRTSIFIEMALLAAALAFVLYRVAARRFGTVAGLLAGALILTIPLMQVFTDEIMAEVLLVLTSFASALFYARYLDSGRWQDSTWFGVFASLAVLTKGNGWAMAIVPPVALLLTRRFSLMRRFSFWLPGIIVGVLCGPWQALTMDMVHRGWTGGDSPNVAFALMALREFLKILVMIPGPVLGAVAALGLIVEVVVPAFRGPVESLWAVMSALIFAVWIFHAVVPAGIEDRKMVCAIPAMILFLLAGAKWITDRLPARGPAIWRPAAVAIVLALCFSLTTFAIPQEQHYGFTETAEFIDTHPDLRNQVVLVSSERDGEGMLISELAMRESRPMVTVLRASKVLARMDWTATQYESFFNSPAEIMSYLRDAHVGVVVLDSFPPRIPFKHHQLVLQAIREYPASWKQIWSYPNIQVYRVTP